LSEGAHAEEADEHSGLGITADVEVHVAAGVHEVDASPLDVLVAEG